MTQATASSRAVKKKAPAKPSSAAEEEIQLLVKQCRAGKLFAVQDWIAIGKPVNPPPSDRKGTRPQTPLQVAIDRGFHSLVEILLKAGADVGQGRWNGPMDQALQMRRLDMVHLLVEHGYDPTTIRMSDVFSTWDPEIMEYFIERGADVETDFPLADAFRNRIRTALRIFKRYRDRFPHFQKQANIALRHHCREGDLKWVSLLLWAGADPYDQGSDQPDAEESGWGWTSALEFAAIYRHYEVFNLKGVRIQPDHPAIQHVLSSAVGHEEGLPLVERLLKLGVKPNDQENGGSSAIQSNLTYMSWAFHHSLTGDFEKLGRDIDTERSRQTLKAIHILVRAGARWCPTDARQVSDARRSLLKLIPDYTVEFVWIMEKYQACTKEVVIDLLRTDSMKRHMAKHTTRLQQILAKWP